MELNFRSLDVRGYKDEPVPNTLIAHPIPAKHLGIILPGYRYPVDMPPLHYAGRVLLDLGADVLRIEYAYNRTNFMEQPESEQDKWISSDVLAACEAGHSQRPYEQITLIGKSLGTIAMGHLLADRRFHQAACVWLTPLLTVEWLRSRIEEIHPPSLFAIGTADRFYQPEVLTHLERVTNGRVLLIEGVDHSLEVPGDIRKSLLALNQIVNALQEFLSPSS